MDDDDSGRSLWDLTGERALLEDELTRLQAHAPSSQAVTMLQERVGRLSIEVERAAHHLGGEPQP